MTDDSFTLAHLSDLHVTPVQGFTPRHWNLKRILGVANWHRKRKFVHQPDTADKLRADIQQMQPDHIVVSGDLINVGLPHEYHAAHSWLQALGPPQSVSVVPGNHDIYVPLATHPGVAVWADYMCTNVGAAQNPNGNPRQHTSLAFPYVRRFGPVALIGINSAEPTPPGIAAGRVGDMQLRELAIQLEHLADEGCARIVVVHHPPLPGLAPTRRALRDASRLQEVLVRHGAEAVLHGHNHTNTHTWLQTKTGPMPVIGIASGSAAKAHKHESLARYNLLTITRTNGAWTLHKIARGLPEVGGEIVELDRRDLTPNTSPI